MARDHRDDEYDDRDDRPRRRDDRDDEDRPRRRRADDGPPTKQASVLGILALIGGIVSVPVSFIPCCGWVAGTIGGLISLTLGIIGLIQASGSNGRIGKGLPLAGTILGAGAILITILWMLFFTVLAATAPTTPGGGGATGTPVSPSDPITASVPAADLVQEFKDNEAAADAKYKGKVLEVTGRVKKVADLGGDTDISVELDGVNLASVNCKFATSQRAAVADLTTGTPVTVRGRCGGLVVFDIALNDCILMPERTGKGAKKITAEKLRKEADKDLTAATKKYGDQPVEVSGQVTGIDRTDPGVVVVGLGVGMRGDVQCVFPVKNAGGLARVKEGQQLTVRGTCVLDEDAASIVTVKDCTLVK